MKIIIRNIRQLLPLQTFLIIWGGGDANKLLVFLPYVLSSNTIQELMEWNVIKGETTIKSGTATVDLNWSGNRRILLAVPRGNDINDWTFWIYSNGENIVFNISDYTSSPGFTFVEGQNTLSWNKFLMIPVGNWPTESTIDIPAPATVRILDEGTLGDKLRLITESDASNIVYDIKIDNDITINPLVISSRGKNVFVRLCSRSPAAIRTITLGNYGSVFTVENQVTLILNDIILKGGSGNTKSLITINNNGRIMVGLGSKICGNSNIESNGGGVNIIDGVLIIDGGAIESNEATKYISGSGGGVYVDDNGRLYLKSGVISRNRAYKGGGVGMYKSIFIMTGGEIGGNESAWGGGVYIFDSSNAIWAGTISANSVNFKKMPLGGSGPSGIIYGSIAPDGKANSQSEGGNAVYYDWADGYFSYSRNRTLNEYDTIDSDNREVNWDYRDGGVWDPDGSNASIENTVDLSGLTVKTMPRGDLATVFSTITQSTEKNVLYDVIVENDTILAPQHLITQGQNTVIRLQGDGNGIKTITLSDKGSIFYVYDYVTLILENIRLKGVNDNNSPLIFNAGGTVVIEDGTILFDNINVTGTGGGVMVDTGGHLIMNGGEIYNNRSLDYETGSGGGIFLNASSTFHMNNGKIFNNFSEEEGGGVCVYKATFIMYNGEIYNNEGFQGGGVYLDGSVFRKQMAFGSTVSGKIYDNTVPWGKTKLRGSFVFSANGSNIYAGTFGANSDIDEYSHMTTDNTASSPWERL
jgi:hypothetical protein